MERVEGFCVHDCFWPAEKRMKREEQYRIETERIDRQKVGQCGSEHSWSRLA